MLGHLLVAVDGSDHGHAALETAARIASGCGATLTILHVQLSGSALEDLSRFARAERLTGKSTLAQRYTGSAETTALADLAAERARGKDQDEVAKAVGELVLKNAESTARSLGVAQVVTTLAAGDPTQMILDAAETAQTDLLVLGSRGLGTLKGLLLGSVSQKISTHSTISVLVAR